MDYNSVADNTDLSSFV